jgi:hypothetical protein
MKNKDLIPQELFDDLNASQGKLDELLSDFNNLKELQKKIDQSKVSMQSASGEVKNVATTMSNILKEFSILTGGIGKITGKLNEIDSVKILEKLSKIDENINVNKLLEKIESVEKLTVANAKLISNEISKITKQIKDIQKSSKDQYSNILEELASINMQTKKKGIFS